MNHKNFFLAIVLSIIGCGILVAQGGQTAADKNKQIELRNTAMQKAVNDGAAAFAKKDYAVAIDIFQKAYSADLTHPTVPILFKNIAAVRLQRGIDTFNAGMKAADDTMMSASKIDLLAAEEMCKRALILAKTNNYAPDKTAPIIDVQKQIFQKISYAFFYIGSMVSDNAMLQKSADAAKAFLALAAANDSSRTDAEQILAELKSSYNIVPK
jgi:tetratricopeptide (TPR) repeat protein